MGPLQCSLYLGTEQNIFLHNFTGVDEFDTPVQD